jgi:ubiquilin
MMAMLQQMMGGQGASTAPPATFGATAPTQAGATSPVNPLASMMQQMMQDPAQMQQMMQTSMQFRSLMGGMAGLGAPGPGGFGAAPTTGTPSTAVPNPMTDAANPFAQAAQRARFASQLTQLQTMGFTDEATCLRVLAEHNGRIDAAIDALLSGAGS